ncbi:double-strand-break repair protein rad21 [Trypanosoma theileri]|uniref:Double-strand-break repair protein rad21 n=1 Tax=Trypanosoma theileri TaxID=67003 RepID=A0A1X0NLU9_9TRYP|nr:double-strand-break repair protein rad21 [Trypanosoma theileri]ORC85090.1 double-strand-break repair protein rad21 [Trypanosoma theileri]
MFFSTYVLTKKGPLAKIWLAAHWDRRLTRNEVRVVDLRQSVVDIVQPAVPIALRTSGELLVGVVRIYALKVKHLLKDAMDATLVLRVTTLTTKSASTPGGSNSINSKEQDPSSATKVLLDGVLLNGGGDIEAVTFDWSSGASANAAAAAGVVASGKTDAEALEARFDDIADLLQGAVLQKNNSITPGGINSNINNNINGINEKDAASALLASAWYALEPTSQAVEELHTTQQDYDEIAKMRADLMAFGDRVSGSSSSKKSSIPSIEKARSSGLTAGAAVLGDLAGFPLPAEELDIGVPLPDDPTMLPDFMMPAPGGEDPLAIPHLQEEEEEDEEKEKQQQSTTLRKARPTNILDLAATTVSAETVQKWMDDRSDIVEAIPRRGPYDVQEVRDRTLLSAESNKGDLWAVVNAAPLAWMPNPALRTLYSSLLLPALEQAEASILPLYHHPQQQQQQQEDPFQQIPAGGMEEEEAFLARANEDENGEFNGNNNALQNRKRALDKSNEDDEDDENNNNNNNNGNQSRNGGLSAAAITTLKRIREVLVTPSQQQQQPPNKRSKKESAPRERCLLQEVCRGMHRREAARTFANVLALASKQLVFAQQPSSSGDVELGLLAAADGVLLKV